MLRSRVIPCLLLRRGGLVKTVNFGDAKYVGDPQNAIRIFNEKEVDELCVLDIDATAERRPPSFDLISKLADQCRMPLTYGGGVQSADHAQALIQLGVEKVSLGPRVHQDPQLISSVADRVGSQSVVVAIDAARKGRFSSGYDVMLENGRVKSGTTPEALARLAADAGAGEILLNSVDEDGRMTGYDMKLVDLVRAVHDLPMTVLGGAGSVSDIEALIDRHPPIGAAAGSLFVFKGPYKAVLISYARSAEPVVRSP